LRVAQLEGLLAQYIEDYPEQEDSGVPGDGGGRGWSGRFWVGPKLYSVLKGSWTAPQVAAAKWLKLVVGPAGYTVTLETSDFVEADFPGNEQHYDLAEVVGDIHCDRF
jgi:hypothetical protein